MEPCIANAFLSTTNEIQRYTMFFIVVSALHVSRGFSAHDQELKNCICSIGTCQSCVLLPLAWLSRSSAKRNSDSNTQLRGSFPMSFYVEKLHTNLKTIKFNKGLHKVENYVNCIRINDHNERPSTSGSRAYNIWMLFHETQTSFYRKYESQLRGLPQRCHKIMVCYSEVQVAPSTVRYVLTKLT
jgi:hypothetical protein